MNTSQIDGIRKAATLMGNQLTLARLLNVSPAQVNQWMQPRGAKNARPVPPKQAVRIEQITHGGVTRRDLHPDDWADIWPELAQVPASGQEFASETVAGV